MVVVFCLDNCSLVEVVIGCGIALGVEVEKVDLARAKKIWDVVKQFPEKVHKDAIIIDYIIKAGGTKHWEDELKNVAKVGKDLDTKLRNLKVNEARQLLKKTLADLLDLD